MRSALIVSSLCVTAPAGTGHSAVADRNDIRSFDMEGATTFFSKLFNTTDFLPRWHCGTWSADGGWLHILSDTAICCANLAIPAILLFFLYRRRNFLFPKTIMWFFLACIVSSGLTHIVEAGIFGWPDYRFFGLLKGVTAIISWVTVLAIVRLVPNVLTFPEMVVETNELTAELVQRRETERQLQESYDEMQRFISDALDREERVIELKREVNSLVRQLGEEPYYSIQEKLK